MRLARLIMALAVMANFAQASALPAEAREEIAAVLKMLADSNCEFYRNGSWYAGSRAASHLQRKLDYLEKKGLISSADVFITLGATESSMTGEAYQVRCPDEVAEPSAQWLRRRLELLRAGEEGGH